MRNAGERWKTTIGLISKKKKTTLHVQQTFFGISLCRVFHDYNVKLTETS